MNARSGPTSRIATFRFETQAGFLLITRPWNGGPPATLRVTRLDADWPAIAGLARAAAHSVPVIHTTRLRFEAMPFPFQIRCREA
jgi:hypothetical protein